MIEEDKKLKEIDTIIKGDGRGGCLCSWYEQCENCNTYSSYNRLRKQIREVIHGKDPQPTLEDYGRSVDVSDIFKEWQKKGDA